MTRSFGHALTTFLLAADPLVSLSAARGLVVIRVDDDAPPGGDGMGWSTAFDDLQDALALATVVASGGEDVEVRVGQGTYRPARRDGDRALSFEVPENVSLLGGFAGLGTPNPNARDFEAFASVLSGDLNDNDVGRDYNETWDENTFTVLDAHGGPGDMVEGFVITRGVNVLGASLGIGGGVSIIDSDVTIQHCILRENYALAGGGAMLIAGMAPRIIACDFLNNGSGLIVGLPDTGKGGAVWNLGSDAVFERCRFVGNRGATGGGVRISGGNPVFRSCAFIANEVLAFGGGVTTAGGQPSSPHIENCTFFGNSARTAGSAIYHNQSQQIFTVDSCTIWGNTGAPPVSPLSPGIEMFYSLVEGGWTGAGWENIDADPLFVDPVGDDGIPGTEDDNLRFSPDSPGINEGNPDYVSEPGQLDLDGHARVLCGRVDMGAYEFGIGDFECDRDVDLFDLAFWEGCFTGPDNGPLAAGCESFDFDGDLDVDFEDYGGIQRAFAGP